MHMAYGEPGRTDIGELYWYEDRTEALQYSRFSGSGERRMDGTQVVRSPIIAGLDKLSRIQQLMIGSSAIKVVIKELFD